MKFFLGLSLCLIIAISVMQNWIWLACLCTLLFSLRFHSAALILLAIVLDGYYGAFYTVPILSLSAICWLIFIEALKPKLITYRN